MSAVDVTKLHELVRQKYLSVQKHSTHDLLIWNYTAKAQFDRFWTEDILMCRGLITDSNGNIKARCLPKFFNAEEHEGALPEEPFEVFEKYDGSLGITYWVDGEPFIATRGSFVSDQAIKANEILKSKYADAVFMDGYTFLFEILFPQNRICVDYHGIEDLILLAVVETETGVEITNIDEFKRWGWNVAKRYDGINDIRSLTDMAVDNAEGFVVRFQSGLRLKIKFDEYVRLHRLITGVSNKSIWELLAQGKDMAELLDRVPDEFFDWVKITSINLNSAYQSIEAECKSTHELLGREGFVTRKDEAMWINANAKYPHIQFNMLTGKDYSEAIWKLVKPEYAKPFTRDIDA